MIKKIKKFIYRELLDVLFLHDRDHLESVVKRLKQSDGEGWAAGELLERAIGIYFS